MFLSNRSKLFLIAVALAFATAACGPPAGNDNKPISLGSDDKGEFPFSTKEPAIFQGNFVVSDGMTERKWFIARNGDKLRIDHFSGDTPAWSQIETDTVYILDHRKKTYASPQSVSPDKTGDQGFVNDITSSFFRGKEYREFQDIGRDGNLIKYRVRDDEHPDSEVLISIDEQTGLMVRQEFASRGERESDLPVKFVYEIRDLKTEADDSLFQIPAGYRKVSWKELRSNPGSGQ